VAIEYLGSKRHLIDFVLGPIVAENDIASVADVFCGTAAVSHALGQTGIRVVANDHLLLCATLAEAVLLPPGRPFRRLDEEISRRPGESRYEAVVRSLNALEPIEGFFYRTYSPASAKAGVGRMYLTEANAAKIDAIRARIERWSPALSGVERAILLRDLVKAVSAVSNTAGTYGCYLKSWKRRALQPLRLTAVGTSKLAKLGHEVHCKDAASIVAQAEVDAVYLDPPYTKRQYAAYYHLLETLVAGSEPEITGSTGLPKWEDKQSDFCYRRRAGRALKRLVEKVSARHLFMSYSEDGHITHDEIVSTMRRHGGVRWWEQATQRYRSNSGTHRGLSVRERLYHLEIA
jgi:adenine-specific DNA-methyltransferase